MNVILPQLVYALVFLVAHCQGRTSYPAEGWSNSNYIFTDSDIEVGASLLFSFLQIWQIKPAKIR